MKMLKQAQVALFIVFYVAFELVVSQIPPRSEKFYARSAEVPFILCQVCQKGVRHLVREVKQLKTKKGKADEDDILSVVEKICQPNSKHGDWIEKYDIVEESGGLKLVEFNERSKCKEECKTIAKACEESISEVDTDLGELLWRQKYSTSQLTNEVCNKMTSACSKKGKKYNLVNRKDEKFVPMSQDEQSANDVLKEMRGIPGMPGMEMYSREDIAKMQEKLGSPQDTEEKVEKPAEESEKSFKSGNPGLFETIQAVGRDVVSWFKNLFGFKKKTEL